MHPARRVFTIEYWRDGDWLVGRLHGDPSVFSQGKTLAELEGNLRDAHRLMHDADLEAPNGRPLERREIQIEPA